MKMTRRRLAVSAVASAAALNALAPGVPAQSPQTAAPDSEEQLLQAARAQVKRNSEALAKFAVPTALEPAFQFKP